MRIEYETELYHHGIKGQKWGVRRYQNLDGTRTAAGRKRYAKQLTKEYNKASTRYVKLDYRRKQADESRQRAEKFASATNKGILKPLSKISSAYANTQRKVSANYDRKAKLESNLANATLEKAMQEGFTTKIGFKPTVVDIKYYGYVTQYVLRNATKVKVTDPTQPKTRAERREEKDRNRLKNAAFEQNQLKEEMRAKNKEAREVVGVNKYKHRDYGTFETWKDASHPLVKSANEAARTSYAADKRFAKEFDAYKKKHPNTTMDLSDWEKLRRKIGP